MRCIRIISIFPAQGVISGRTPWEPVSQLPGRTLLSPITLTCVKSEYFKAVWCPRVWRPEACFPVARVYSINADFTVLHPQIIVRLLRAQICYYVRKPTWRHMDLLIHTAYTIGLATNYLLFNFIQYFSTSKMVLIKVVYFYEMYALYRAKLFVR